MANNILNDVKRMDRLLEYVDSINDERDSVPILVAIRELWPLIREVIVENAEWQDMWSKLFDYPERLG